MPHSGKYYADRFEFFGLWVPCQVPCQRPLNTPETGAMPGAMPKLMVSGAVRVAEIPREFANCSVNWRARQVSNLRPSA